MINPKDKLELTMNILEQQIAETVAFFLTARGERIACDHGLLELKNVDGAVVGELTGKQYEIVISVVRVVGR